MQSDQKPRLRTNPSLLSLVSGSDQKLLTDPYLNPGVGDTPLPSPSNYSPSPLELEVYSSEPVRKSLMISRRCSTVDVNPHSLQHMLINGSKLLKISKKSNTKPMERTLKVELFPQSLLLWENKNQIFSSIPFQAILEIRMGQNTEVFKKNGKDPSLEERTFSIIYLDKGKYKTLNFLTPHAELCSQWVFGLHILLTTQNSTIHELLGFPAFLKEMWNKIDSANEGLLDLDRITLLMKSLNIKLSRNEIKSALKQSNISKSSLVNFDTFERFYSSLRFRPEIAELFSNLCLTNPQYLTFNEFYTFVCETQQMGWDKLRCEEIFQKFLDSDTNGMDIEHFTIFLISSRNNVFRKTCMEVYQDMDRPLCDYFINSSHNTYLLGDQIVSESSVEGYIRALQKGCRCVELDCWDGPNLQPVIYHGRTLTSKIFFKDAIETICKYAFVSCSTPLILSFEMHCSLEQQNIIARMLINTFGDSLLAEPVAGYPLNLLPSPNLLKNKVLIKCKYPDTIYDEQQDSGDDTKVSTTPIEGVILKRPSLLSLRRPPSSESNENCDVVRPKTKTFQISKSLSKLIPYLRGTPSKGLETLTSDLQFNHLFSFTEGKATTFMQKQLDTYKQLTSANLLRVYPSILRVTSSNYDPLPYWINGTQMVALNFQTFDRSMELNKALFEDNGGCGFVLKPSKLSKPRRIRIDVISAQQIQQTIANPSDSIKAVVTIETFGHEVDNLKFKTTTKKSNGFNPLWKEHFEFQIQYPDFCFMRFQLVDVDPPFTNAQCFGSYTIRLSCLMPGYRHIPLNDRMGERLGFSTVFVKISFNE